MLLGTVNPQLELRGTSHSSDISWDLDTNK